MHPSQKYALMNWLARNMGLPGRVAAQVLQEWGAALQVEITATDYELVRNHMTVERTEGFAGSG